MKSLLPFLILLPMRAGADLTIFDTRKNLAMAEGDPVYHDYYVNGGVEAGLSPGMVLTVTRKLPLYDNYLNHSAGDLLLKGAKVRIIQAQKGRSVARQLSEFTRENAPLLEDPFIMIGDELDLSTATNEGKKTASAEAEGKSQPVAPKAVAQISVNAVDISSTAPPAAKSQGVAPTPAVDAPKLQ